MNVVFDVHHVSKWYKKGNVKANNEISFQVQQGEVLGLLGPNGAGKSTIIKQMVGHTRPDSGEIRYLGTDVLQQTKRVAQEVSYYAQEPNSLTSLKTWEVLYCTGRLRGLNKKEALTQTEKLLDRFDLLELRNKQLKHLSGGQKRLVGIGTSLIGHMPVMIFDEPTNELDPKKRRLVWDIIQEKKHQEGVTVILVTHNVLEAEQIVDRIAMINHGKLLTVDHISKLKQKVDQRLRCEMLTQQGKSEEIISVLKRWGSIEKMGENKLRLLVEKQEASHLLQNIIDSDYPIMEYSLVPPNLEDVYFYIDKEEETNE